MEMRLIVISRRPQVFLQCIAEWLRVVWLSCAWTFVSSFPFSAEKEKREIWVSLYAALIPIMQTIIEFNKASSYRLIQK